jgi:hypothetical protein
MQIIDIEKVEKFLPEIKNGVDKYISIMKEFRSYDVSQNMEFQKSYNGFYRIRQRSTDFYKCYYDYMERGKNSSLIFKDVVEYFNNRFNRIEASFSSKLLATINPNMPVWDSIVLKNLGLKPPAYYKTNRLENIISMYTDITNWYKEYLMTRNSVEILKVFDSIYPDTKLTCVKKIDFVLWSIRE